MLFIFRVIRRKLYQLLKAQSLQNHLFPQLDFNWLHFLLNKEITPLPFPCCPPDRNTVLRTRGRVLG
jgi:hypothetical protein